MLSVLEETNARTKVDRSTLVRKHYEFQSNRFVSEMFVRDGLTSVFSGITPSPMWNHSFCEGGIQAETVKSISEWHSKKRRCPVIYLEAAENESAEILRGQQFEKFDEEAWMILRHAAEIAGGKDECIAEVRSKEEFREFVRVFQESFQSQDNRYKEAFEQNGTQSIQINYLLKEGGRAVCAGTLIHDGAVACIYNVGTPPKERKKGYAARMMKHIISAATGAGCEIIFLQVENKSAPSRLYERLGFQTEFVRHGYRLANWKARDWSVHG